MPRRTPWSRVDRALLVIALIAALTPFGLHAAHAGVCGFLPCTPTDRLGVTRSADGDMQLLLYPCTGDRATRAALIASGVDGRLYTGDDEVLWEVTGDAALDALTFTIGGSPPNGFRETIPVSAPVRGDVMAVIETRIDHRQSVDFGELQPGLVGYMGQQWSIDGWEREVRRSASCSDFTEQRAPTWHRTVTWTSWVLAAGLAARLLVPRHARSPRPSSGPISA
jgi:hypothetical protein